MARPIVVEPDYRKTILRMTPQREAGLGWVPDRADLARRASHYAPIVDAFVPADRGARVLELGCGWGAFLAALVERGYTRLAAVEMLPECCARVKDTTGVEPVCSDIFAYLEQAEGPYDLVAAFDVMVHFRKNEILALLGRILDLLAPAGVFVMRVPNCESLGGVSALYSGFTHETGFTAASARELLDALGFTDILCMPEPTYARTPARTALKRMAKRVFGQILSLSASGMVAPAFAVSSNVIAGGKKPPE